MKGKKSSMIRMENLINGDRLKHSGEFSELLTGDVNRVLKDYFDYKGYPLVEVMKNGGFYAELYNNNSRRGKIKSVLIFAARLIF